MLIPSTLRCVNNVFYSSQIIVVLHPWSKVGFIGIVRHMKLIIILPFLLAGCSFLGGSDSSDSSSSQGLDASVYLAKSSLIKAPQFEHHVLKGSKVFSECGTSQNGKNKYSDQKMSSVSEKKLAKLKRLASDLTASAGSGDIRKLSDKAGFFDQGKVLITIKSDGKTTEIETTINTIANPQTPRERKAATFASKMRRAGATNCGNISFFGVS